MTSAEDRNDFDHNNLMPAQEKLEWVTPKISLMEAGSTNSGSNAAQESNGGLGAS
jgi:hypothetical protein